MNDSPTARRLSVLGRSWESIFVVIVVAQNAFAVPVEAICERALPLAQKVSVDMTMVAQLRGHTDSVQALSFSPSGAILASGSDDTTVKIWDVKTKEVLGTLMGHKEAITCLHFSPDSAILVSGSRDGSVKIWDVRSRTELGFLKHDGPVCSVNVSPDGSLLAVAGAGRMRLFPHPEPKGELKVWHLGTLVLRKKFEEGEGPIFSVVFLNNNKTLAVGVGNKGSGHSALASQSKLALVDVESMKMRKSVVAHKGWCTRVIISPDGKVILTGGTDGWVRVWDSDSLERKQALGRHEDGRMRIACSVDSSMIVTCDYPRLRLWDRAIGREIRWSGGQITGGRDVAFSPDGKLLAFCALESNEVLLMRVGR